MPLASYLFDLVASVNEFEATVRGARGPLPRAEVLELLDLLGTQASSCFSFLQERLDELEGLSKDGLRAASFEPMYGNERSQSGARSRLGQALHASHLSRRHTSRPDLTILRLAKCNAAHNTMAACRPRLAPTTPAVPRRR